MPIIELTDPGDPRLADYRSVRDPELARTGGIFIAEGRQVVSQLLAGHRFPARSVLVTDATRRALATDLADRPDLPVYLVPPTLVHEVAGFHIHQGCLAVGARLPLPSWRNVADGASRLLALEAVGNPDNVGGLFRNARAFCAGGVLLGPGCADPLYRKSIRTSMGGALQVPFAQPADWPGVLKTLRTEGWKVVGATPAPAARPLRDAAATLARERVVIVLGHEGKGLTGAALDASSEHVRIPMVPGVDSLNVATVGAIFLYELARYG